MNAPFSHIALCLFISALSLSAQQKTSYVEKTEPLTAHTLKKGDVYKQVTLVRPTPAERPETFKAINPFLPSILKDFYTLIERGQVSPQFKKLYDLKVKHIKEGNTLTSHNYFDCASILNITHPSGQKVVWIQADMDVVTDGSDPNRFPHLSDYNEARTSDWFLPATGYSWSGASPRNPFLDYYPEAITKIGKYRRAFEREAERDGGVIWRGLIAQCDFQTKRMKIRNAENLSTMKSRRSLVAVHDPFVVIPQTWFKERSSYALSHGDKAAVIYENRIIPAIVGDAGPSYKIGEASLKIAKALNTQSSGKVRAVNSLGVSYLIFPKTADKPRGAPELKRINEGVSSLLNKIGGVAEGGHYTAWKNTRNDR